MAKVTIVITDDGDSVNVKIESEPPWPGPAAKDQSVTTAQSLGIEFMEFMKHRAGSDEPSVVDEDD